MKHKVRDKINSVFVLQNWSKVLVIGFKGNLMQAFYLYSINISYFLFLLQTLSTHESLYSTMNGFLTAAMSCICIDISV
jgi:hypothetical protein